MTNVFLLGEETIKNYSPLLQNVDGKFISTGIRLAQDTYIESTLGTDLYVKLQDLIKFESELRIIEEQLNQPLSGDTLTQVLANYNNTLPKALSFSGNTNYKILLENFILDPLLNFAIYNIIVDISYKLGNVNVLSMNSENSNPATLSELKFIQQKWLDRGEFYLERLKRYLCDKQSLYPELQQNIDMWKTRPNSKSAYFENIYIKNKYRGFGKDDWKYLSGPKQNGGN